MIYFYNNLKLFQHLNYKTGRKMETLDYNESDDEYKKQIFDLNTILNIGKTLNSSLSLKNVLDIVVLTCSGHFHSSDALILLSSEDADNKFFTYQSKNENISVGSSGSFMKYLKDNPGVIYTDELRAKSNLKDVYKLAKEKNIELIVPLRFKGNINGLLCLMKKEKEFGSKYTREENRYIDILAGFASVAIENAKLYEMATLDKKTKLYNHGFFKNRLIEEIERAERYKKNLSLMILDLDHFKKVNDTYGHMFGDKVLIKVSQTIKDSVRSFDIPARFGGEEFTVILPETTSERSLSVAKRLRRRIEKLIFSLERHRFGITVSIGVANFVYGVDMTEDIIIEHADKALYYAKEHGRNQVIVYEDIVNNLKV